MAVKWNRANARQLHKAMQRYIAEGRRMFPEDEGMQARHAWCSLLGVVGFHAQASQLETDAAMPRKRAKGSDE